MNKHEEYREQVALVLRILPHIYELEQLAVHGGTAINLFHKNMPRYSVDIDLTYLPIEDRETSLREINRLLGELRLRLLERVKGIRVIHKPDVWKLQCTLDMAMVKVEVNGTKCSALGAVETRSLCAAAEADFHTKCKAHVVGQSQLYGGKLSAALSRQHPRDLFDFVHMGCGFDEVRNGLLLALAGSDKPIIESLAPNAIDQHDALEKQFVGMTDEPFSYADYEEARVALHRFVMEGLSDADKWFLVSLEKGEPDWNVCSAGDLSRFPSVQWKQRNIEKLRDLNPEKYVQGVEKLERYLDGRR